MGFAQGKTMLFRRDLLKSAGGIRALAFEAAEDAAATKLVRKTGLRVRVVDQPFPQPLGAEDRSGGLETATALGAASTQHV
jgi:ceramide glucosyltransferase